MPRPMMIPRNRDVTLHAKIKWIIASTLGLWCWGQFPGQFHNFRLNNHLYDLSLLICKLFRRLSTWSRGCAECQAARLEKAPDQPPQEEPPHDHGAAHKTDDQNAIDPCRDLCVAPTPDDRIVP